MKNTVATRRVEPEIVTMNVSDSLVEAATNAGWHVCGIAGPGDIGRGVEFGRMPADAPAEWERKIVWGQNQAVAEARAHEFLAGQAPGSSKAHKQAVFAYVSHLLPAAQ